MANSANPEINKKIATSALGTLVIATVFFYLGDRYAETLVTYPGQIFDHLSDAFLSMWQTIKDAPFALDMTSNSLLFGGACFLIIWMIWLRYVAFIGNYRSGEESGSARWGTVKEGKKFKDLQTEDNNLLFTKNFGLALHRPKFDPEYDRNLNVLVVGGSGSGKTFNYVTPNICQLNTSYFVTDPKGTLLKDAGYLFTDNGYKLKSFNTINLDESMHYNPLKYVKTDTDILSFVNCFIMNTNPEGKSSGDPFWENAEKMLYTALIALLRDWFPAKDYNMSSLLTLLSLAEALLIDAMDNADSIYTVFARLQLLAVKCGCAGKLLLHESVPYTDEMLAAVTKKTVPAFRQCMQPLVQLGLVICEDGIYAIADWEFNQNVPAIDAMREGNRVRKASERARKNGKGTRQVKKDKVLAYLTEHPEATNTEVAEKTGVSRPSVIKYRKEYAPALPAPKGGKIVKDDGTKVDTVKIDGVKVDSFDSKVDVNFDVKVDSDFDTGFYTDADGKSAGRQSAQVENEAVKIASRPKNIDDRYKNTSTSTAIADGEGATGSGIPTREEVRSHFAEMGFAVDPDRFFDVNEGRGWRTNSGKPVDDWKKLAAVWDRNEHPKTATPPARTEPKANAVGKIPSVEEVMAKWGCDRETAQGYIDENMY